MTLEPHHVNLLVERLSATIARSLDYPFATSPEFFVDYDIATARQLIRMVQRVAVQREEVARYPATWWDAVKERFAPEWFTRRWPIEYTTLGMEVLYPKVLIPRMQHSVRFVSYKPSDIMPTWSNH
jgi:hypothetical protein